MAERLDYVYQLSRAPDLKAFHARLLQTSIARGGRLPSYAAALTYHKGTASQSRRTALVFRDPPTIYLAAIAEAVPSVNMHWLVTGEGLPTVSTTEEGSAAETLHAIRRRLVGRVVNLYDAPPEVASALLRHLDLRDREWNRTRGVPGESHPDRDKYAKKLWHDIEAPLEHRRPRDLDAFGTYAIAALLARDLAVQLDTYDPRAEN